MAHFKRQVGLAEVQFGFGQLGQLLFAVNVTFRLKGLFRMVGHRHLIGTQLSKTFLKRLIQLIMMRAFKQVNIIRFGTVEQLIIITHFPHLLELVLFI